jgi:anti-sigma B factor antagonist
MFSNEPAIRDDGAHVVVTLRGELDIANAADLGAVLSEAVARNPHVIADLSDLTFIDCASLGVVVRARTRAREAGGDLVLAGARGRVRRVLALPFLAGVFPVDASVDEAARKGQTCAFRNFGAGWDTVHSRRAEPGLLDLGRSGGAAAHEACGGSLPASRKEPTSSLSSGNAEEGKRSLPVPPAKRAPRSRPDDVRPHPPRVPSRCDHDPGGK